MSAPTRRGSTRQCRRWLRWAVILGVTVSSHAVQAADRAPIVIVLSWDGVRHDYPDRGDFPGLARMQRDGVRAERLTPVSPASTFPNHVALATGTYPDRHGIVENSFRDRERGIFSYSNDASWIEAEPLWAAAERQGVRAAVFFWVGSETDWEGVGASYRRAPFDSDVDEDAKVDQILRWLDLPEAEAPRLIMSWWHGCDRVGHLKGPDHEDIATQLADQDRKLQRLISGIEARRSWRDTTLLVVSDHGMTGSGETIEIREPLERAGVAAQVQARTGTAHVFLENASSLEQAHDVLERVAGARVYRGDALPPSLRLSPPHRTGDLVLTTDPPRTFRQDEGFDRVIQWALAWLGFREGGHGYSGEHPDMGAIFLALGRGVEHERPVGPVRAIDVAPTIARLLSIEPPRDSEGRAVLDLERVDERGASPSPLP